MSSLRRAARRVTLAATALALGGPAGAQERGAAALGPLVAGLGTSARVLVVGAHPEDDEPALLAYLSRGRGARAAYLSLTRGEGGVNLIGGEASEALGVLRTEELLAARRVDGGEQFFTRAFDFGFSKSVDETRERWWGEGQLGDVVRIVRAFRPHVIVSVHDVSDRDPHAHHRVAGMLAREAFEAAATDTARYRPGAWGRPWRALKLYQLVADSAGTDTTVTLRLNAGEYAPLLGRSFAEIGAESRGKQRTQGLGVVPRPGARWLSLRLLAARWQADASAEKSLFAGIDTTFGRLRRDGQDPAIAAALDSIAPLVARVQGAYRADDPSAALEPLAALATLAARTGARSGLAAPGARIPTPADPDLVRSLEDLWRRAQDMLALGAGVAVEATAERDLVAQATAADSSDTLRVAVAVHNRGRVPVSLELALLSNAPNARAVPRAVVAPDRAWRGTIAGTPRAVTQPWWREQGRIKDMYNADVDGRTEEERAASNEAGTLRVTTRLRIAGGEAYVTVPVVRRAADPVRGEVQRPVAVAPGITARVDRSRQYARAGAPLQRPLRVTLRSAYATPRDVEVTLDLPPGLGADSAKRRVQLPAGGTRDVTFLLRGTPAARRYDVPVIASTDKEMFVASVGTLEYDHVAPQRLYSTAGTNVQGVELTLPRGIAVAYLGAPGDAVPPMLQQLGVPVTVIDPAALLLPVNTLSRFTAVVVGPRAYQTRPELADVNGTLLAYARAGGTLVVQYGQQEMTTPGLLPYPIALGTPAQRVTDESSPVRMLVPLSPVLSSPNRIGERDFAGWVQDRALFIPQTFDGRWRAALEVGDKDDPPARGALLVAPYGKGVYVYTTLSLFRQLPATNPGAARLFVNLLAARPPAPAPARTVE